MASNGESSEIRSAARGPHWIAWVTAPGSEQPDGSIVIVGETQEEAEANAREWLRSIYR
jgi:hypothetical protein